jgi:hypothetical protein
VLYDDGMKIQNLGGWVMVIILLVLILLGLVIMSMQTTNGPKEIACTADAQLCPDGSAVGRVPPHCDFAPCPQGKPPGQTDIFCGGIAGVLCPEEMTCKLDGDYPDAGGTCVR